MKYPQRRQTPGGGIPATVLSLGLFALLGVLGGVVTAAASSTAWQSPYSGPAATGNDIIALWHFDPNTPGRDASGHGHDLQLQKTSTQFAAGGKFGGALQVTVGPKVVDQPHGAVAPLRDDLTPKGAFTIELWMQPTERLASLNTAFLIDKKGYPYPSEAPHANDDYMLWLVNASNNMFHVEAQLGYGKNSDAIRSVPVMLTAGQWYHVAFTYDGKGGSNIYLDGRRIGQAQHDGRSAVSKGVYALTIGDRTMGSFAPFPGKIDEVRLSNGVGRFTTGKIQIDAAGTRTAFQRMEDNAVLPVTVVNGTDATLHGVSVSLSAQGMSAQNVPLADIESGAQITANVPLDTRAQAGTYTPAIALIDASGKTLTTASAAPLKIVVRPLPHQMPVMMWEFPLNLEEVKAIGFTSTLVPLPRIFQQVMDAGKPLDMRADTQWQSARQRLDELLSLGLSGAAMVEPGSWAAGLTEYGRRQRDGKPYDHPNVDGLHPRMQSLWHDIGVTVAESLGDMPSFQSALLDTEVRDHTQLSFSDIDKQAYRQFSGRDIPENISSVHGVHYRSLQGFPASRIIPDNFPILDYYRWFWKQGDGWNGLFTQENDGLHSVTGSKVWTWFDPAIRVPSVWGSGGNVDYLSQWTYSYPAPLKIDLACNALEAMAQGRPNQQTMHMIQAIWYRSETAPEPKAGQKPAVSQAQWEKEQPDARFISIAPDHLSEGTWLELSYPIKGIMIHGWGSLVQETNYPAYRMTNPQTKVRLTELLHKVVKPLGPTLMQVPDAPSDVAYLESFTSQILAGRGTYGWSVSDSYLTLRHAAIQPQVIYEETILKHGLKPYKVLVLIHCDVLPQSVAAAIKEFQLNGGIIIGDASLAPGIQADILMPPVPNTKKADAYKAGVLAAAAKLRKELDAYYAHPSDSSNPEVIVRQRRYNTSDYFFAVNDHRTFGNYVGQHGLVMEKGVPSRATLKLKRDNGYIYDLSESKPVTGVRQDKGYLSFDSYFGPGQGRLFLITSQAISAVEINAPQQAAAGEAITCEVTVTDEAGKAIDAVVPMRIQITDANGKEAEFSGYYGARDGRVELKLDLPRHTAAGTWKIKATELASGQTRQADVKVTD